MTNITKYFQRRPAILSNQTASTASIKRTLNDVTAKTTKTMGQAADYVQSAFEKMPLGKLHLSAAPLKNLFRPAAPPKPTATYRAYQAAAAALPADPLSRTQQHGVVLQLIEKLIQGADREGVLRKSGSQADANKIADDLRDSRTPDISKLSIHSATTTLKKMISGGYELIPPSYYVHGQAVADASHAEVIDAAERLFAAIEQNKEANKMSVYNVSRAAASWFGVDTATVAHSFPPEITRYLEDNLARRLGAASMSGLAPPTPFTHGPIRRKPTPQDIERAKAQAKPTRPPLNRANAVTGRKGLTGSDLPPLTQTKRFSEMFPSNWLDPQTLNAPNKPKKK